MLRLPSFLCRFTLILMLSSPVLTAVSEEPLPWALRAHYSFPTDNGTVDFSEDKGDLRFRAKDETIIADGIGFVIRLADGTELRAEDLGKPETERTSDIQTPVGQADRFSVRYPGKNGLEVVVSMRKPELWPFLVRTIELKNTGEAPVEIASIAPIVAGSGVITGLSPDALYVPRKVSMRGGHPVFNNVGRPLAARFEDRARGFVMAFGVLPDGHGTPSATFTSFNGEWHGEVVSVFDPPRVLKMGEQLAADRVAISYSMTDTQQLDVYYCWGLAMNLPRRPVAGAPSAWVTVSDEGSLSDLISTGQRWSREGVQHVLVPASWEGRPGSMEGASPRFPRNMGSAAQQIQKAGLMPGIAFDALSVDKARNGTVASADGQHWANPTTKEGLALMRDKVKRLAQWDFAFLAVAESTIPEDVLKAHGITRAQADAAAFAAIQDAAGTLPVYPVSEGEIELDETTWIEAAQAVRKLNDYGAVPAPVRLSVDGLDDVAPPVLNAIRRWPGVIELVGVPKGKGLRALGTVVGAARMTAKR